MNEVIDKNNEKRNSDSRAKWTNDLQFLMSCIAFSVGLGNVWRFPYTAYENGGGAFIIPYLIVLFIVGKPFYYMEMIIGQFASRSCVQVWSISPAFKGIGFGVTVAAFSVATYYAALMALILFYLGSSFQSTLPWATCREEWGDECFSSSQSSNNTNNNNNNTSITNITQSSSAELFFIKVVLNELEDINNGIGRPSWILTLCLAFTWILIILIVFRGVKSAGKASYFLALFPYIIMIALFIRAVTLPGASGGILFLFKPEWNKILYPKVWYAAVSQAFFSLGVCFGAVTMYSSYNNFQHNVIRDCTIVTTLDLFTSLLAGTTIFGILGNLAYELGTDDISSVVRSGTALAFISYPDALAKFTLFPQLFSVLFFLMLYILGLGSVIAFTNVVISVINDAFPQFVHWKVVVGVCISEFLIGIIYCTPGGQFILTLVDYFGGTLILVFLACFEVVGISWVYGVDNFLDDIEFMAGGKRPFFYWRFCWCILTPLMLFIILFYFLFTITPLTYNDKEYPTSAYVAGWALLCLGIVQFPLWFLINKLQNKNKTWFESFKSSQDWGPKDEKIYLEWREFKDLKYVLNKEREEKQENKKKGKLLKLLFGR